jgi:small subunit ribosomal protein S25e
MGGKKRLSLKQMERARSKKGGEDKEKRKEKTGPSKERKPSAITPPDSKSEKVIAELKKMRLLTPYAVATHFNIRISAAKDLLRQLQATGAIELVSGNHKIKIYKAD